MRVTGIVLLLIGLLFGLDAVNVGRTIIDEGPLSWILVGLGCLILLGSRMQSGRR